MSAWLAVWGVSLCDLECGSGDEERPRNDRFAPKAAINSASNDWSIERARTPAS